MTSPGFVRRHWIAVTLAGLVLIPSAIFALWATITLSYTYSSGTRTGYLQKLSRKGWLCKTWEGELAMATAPGVSPQIFTFTIRSPSVFLGWDDAGDSLAAALSADMGRGRVSVEYEEHRGVPTSCFGDTPYFVTGYRLMADPGVAPLP